MRRVDVMLLSCRGAQPGFHRTLPEKSIARRSSFGVQKFYRTWRTLHAHVTGQFQYKSAHNVIKTSSFRAYSIPIESSLQALCVCSSAISIWHHIICMIGLKCVITPKLGAKKLHEATCGVLQHFYRTEIVVRGAFKE